MLGPIYDLNTLWESHCYHEFATRDVDAVMPTMVAQPYVNHVPTMTGGVGHDQLKRFYKYHFVDANPEDTRLIPLSRTIGADRIVDEFVFCATHDREIDWLLPGLAPTGKYFEIPMLAESSGVSVSRASTSRMRVATCCASGSPASGKIRANSSPPYRDAVSIARQ